MARVSICRSWLLSCVLALAALLAGCGGPPLPSPAGAAAGPTAAPDAPPEPTLETTIPAHGAVFAYIDRKGNIVLATPGGNRNLVWYRSPARRFAWAPDGRRIVVEAEDGLHLWDATSGAVQLLRDGAAAGGFAWAPDGRSLAFASAEGLRLWEASTTLARTIAPGARLVGDPSWSPDGSALLFTRQEGDGPSRSSVWLWEAGPGEARKVADGDMPAWRPAGDAEPR